MEGTYDVVIVGGGPGGLTIGSLLAREGISSAIIEREPTLGGRYRSIDFHGCRSDNGVRMPAGLVPSAQETYMYKFLDYMGLAPSGTKLVPWTMGMIRKDAPGGIEYFQMDPDKGVDNFFDFFAFGSGLPMEEPSRQSMGRAFKIMEDTSIEECHRLLNVSFGEWIDRNVEDPIANTVLHLASPLMGALATDVNYGAFANVFRTFPKVGSLLFWYPTEGNMESMVIDPLTKYYTEHGGTVLTNRRVRSILVEDGRATGVVAHNSETILLEEYSAKAVICALPIFEALARNVLRREYLTEDWAEAIDLCGRLTYEDLSVFYLLREEVFPKDGHGWVHIFDPDYGMPTYVGDWCLGPLYNANEPPGKQYLYAYIPGGLPDTHLGLSSPPETVDLAIRRWEDAVEKVFPNFRESIEHKGRSLQLNWGRYAWAKVPVEIDIASPNIRGLFFAGDSIRSVASMVSDKIFEMAFPLRDSVMGFLKG